MKNETFLESQEQKQVRLDEYKILHKQIENHADEFRRHGISSSALLRLLSREIAILEYQLNVVSQN